MRVRYACGRWRKAKLKNGEIDADRFNVGLEEELGAEAPSPTYQARPIQALGQGNEPQTPGHQPASAFLTKKTYLKIVEQDTGAGGLNKAYSGQRAG